MLRITYKILSVEWKRLIKPHPMVLVIRPSPSSLQPNIIMGWLYSYFQVIFLGASSFLFGSIVMSTLFLTLIFVATFISAIALSRFLSIHTSAWMEKQLGLTIIEYETESECIAIWLVINSMPDCLVESKNSSYRYANGYIPHKCTSIARDPSVAPDASAGISDQNNIPVPSLDMLETTVQVPEVKAICVLFSIALGLPLGCGIGALSGVLISSALHVKFAIGIAGMLGGTVGFLSFLLFTWRIALELESAAGYGQILQWAQSRNCAD